MNVEKYVAQEPYRISYDREMISNFKFPNFTLILRRALCGNPNPQKGGWLFYRSLFNPKLNETCLQFVLFYRFQKVPPHWHDYHSFLLYLDEKHDVKYLIFDKGHHWSQLVHPPRNKKAFILAVFLWDHRYVLLPYKKIYLWASQPLTFSLKELTPEMIYHLWTIKSGAQIKMRSKLVNPWNPEIKITFRDVFTCPFCQKRHQMDYMEVQGSVLTSTIKCKGHSYQAIYDLKTHVQRTQKLEK